MGESSKPPRCPCCNALACDGLDLRDMADAMADAIHNLALHGLCGAAMDALVEAQRAYAKTGWRPKCDCGETP